MCGAGQDDDTVLLLPELYTFFPRGVAWASRCRLFEPDFTGGVTFGTWLPDSGALSFAHSNCVWLVTVSKTRQHQHTALSRMPVPLLCS